MITDWAHDTYDYSQGNGIMNNRMTVRYETVKYLEGAIGGVRPDTNALGFADPSYYDTVPSALARPGSTHTVLGQGGLLDAGIGIVTDLESGNPLSLIGAAQTAAATYNTWKSGPSIATTLKADVTQAVNNAVRGSLPGAIRAAGVPTNGPSYNASPTGQYGSSGLFIPTPNINLTNY
jgi:hypothetical protein